MKKNEEEVGRCYAAKVSGQMATIRIDAENPRGGWDATNLRTRKKVRIKSAQRLRGKAPARPGRRKKIVSLAEYEADAKAARKDDVAKTCLPPAGRQAVEAVEKGDLTKGVKVPTAKKKHQPKAGKVEKKERKPSGLDATAQVLAEAKDPMGTKEMVERMLAKGLWKTNGKTPAATIYAAIIREIAVKGNESRFRKTDRGHFELTAAGIASRTATGKEVG